MHADLQKLYALAGNHGEPEDWNEHFEPVGSILKIPPEREAHACTPLNARTLREPGAMAPTSA